LLCDRYAWIDRPWLLNEKDGKTDDTKQKVGFDKKRERISKGSSSGDTTDAYDVRDDIFVAEDALALQQQQQREEEAEKKKKEEEEEEEELLAAANRLEQLLNPTPPPPITPPPPSSPPTAYLPPPPPPPLPLPPASSKGIIAALQVSSVERLVSFCFC
jgi:hypothetical protein